MIWGDDEGQRKLEELLKSGDTDRLFEREVEFLDDLRYKGLRYRGLSIAQKNWVSRIYDRVM